MSKKPSEIKIKLHPRNRHRERYDMRALVSVCQELMPFVFINPYGDETIDFGDPNAVKYLNKALLKKFYHIDYWDIPQGYLCPPIPGRADYIHYMADLLAENNNGKIPKGNEVKCWDLGVGANCIYPIIGHAEYGWQFIGSDVDKKALENAQKITYKNAQLSNHIDLRFQKNKKHFLEGIIAENEKIDLLLCNPPFHTSKLEADAGSLRKISNLQGNKMSKPVLNFGGKSNELWCEGGEKVFIQNLIMESRKYAKNCAWFTSLVAKSVHLKSIYATLKSINVSDYKTIEMGQGNKISRVVAWTFLNKNELKFSMGSRIKQPKQ